jgi:hypothetical protein
MDAAVEAPSPSSGLRRPQRPATSTATFGGRFHEAVQAPVQRAMAVRMEARLRLCHKCPMTEREMQLPANSLCARVEHRISICPANATKALVKGQSAWQLAAEG